MSAAPRHEDPASLPIPLAEGPSGGLLGHRLRGRHPERPADEVVMLLNGAMMTFAAWEPVASRILGSYAVLGCDLRGQLLSPGKGHLRLEDHVEDLVALLDALDLGSVHVMGTSFGGEVAVHFASRHPERVRTLALVTAGDRTAPGMKEDSTELQRLARIAADGGEAGLFRDRLVDRVYSDEYLESHAAELEARKDIPLPRIWYEGLLGILESVKDFDLSDLLAGIECPTLVVHASLDGVIPLARVRPLADGIAGAEWRVHPTSGHALVAEDPAWLAETYLEFLARHVVMLPDA